MNAADLLNSDYESLRERVWLREPVRGAIEIGWSAWAEEFSKTTPAQVAAMVVTA
jgi:hypothetical protein